MGVLERDLAHGGQSGEVGLKESILFPLFNSSKLGVSWHEGQALISLDLDKNAEATTHERGCITGWSDGRMHHNLRAGAKPSNGEVCWEICPGCHCDCLTNRGGQMASTRLARLDAKEWNPRMVRECC